MARRSIPAPEEELTAQQQQAIVLLASGKSVTETAVEVGVERETVSRWKNRDAGFASALSFQQAALWDTAQDKLRASVLKAAGALEELLEHEDAAVRLKAIGLAYKALSAYPHNGRAETRTKNRIELDWYMR
jgi:ABC-type transporter Mla maintaining outer membrane lipid asymmetry ATPase subunit MlaF